MHLKMLLPSLPTMWNGEAIYDVHKMILPCSPLMWNREAIWWSFAFHHQCEMEKQFAFVKLCCDILFVIYSRDDALCFSLSFMIQKSCTPFGALGEIPFKKKQCCILHSALTSLRKFMLHFVGPQFWYWLLDILKRVLSNSTGVTGIDVYWFIDFYSMCSNWNQSFILQTQTSVCEFCSLISHSTNLQLPSFLWDQQQIVAG
jgi:hypothetical protein